jgi:GTP-binding protein
VVTNAKPKIADYPFTTLQPNLGVANLDEYATLILADIPGLIEGAHMGVGLGHDFLRHIQRTRVLIHLLDGLGEDPVADLAQINTELALFDESLGQKPQVVAVNKADLPDVQARWPKLEAKLKSRGVEPMLVSAVAGTNVRPLLFKAGELLADAPEPPLVAELPVYRPETDPNEFSVVRADEGWRVIGEAIERAAAMTYWEYDQSVRRFQHIMETLGIDQALRDTGVQNGDTIFIGEYELEWED